MLTPAGSGIGRDGDCTGGPKCRPSVRQATSPDCAAHGFVDFSDSLVPKTSKLTQICTTDLDATSFFSYYVGLTFRRPRGRLGPGSLRPKVSRASSIGHSEGRGPLRTCAWFCSLRVSTRTAQGTAQGGVKVRK